MEKPVKFSWLGPGLETGINNGQRHALAGEVDAIVYDYLANPLLLNYARPGAELIYAGKQGHCPGISQSAINELLLNFTGAGKNVARLKGGDPYVFGRGGEEALALHQAGIEFEIVPGISSAIAGPAYAGISVTTLAIIRTVLLW